VRSKASPSEYLALLSLKYGVDADEFFRALISAKNNRKSTCGNLSIECRKKQKKGLVVLITKGARAVAQLPIPEELLLMPNNPIKEARRTRLLDRRPFKKNGKSAASD
jgi:hypothetical protein